MDAEPHRALHARPWDGFARIRDSVEQPVQQEMPPLSCAVYLGSRLLSLPPGDSLKAEERRRSESCVFFFLVVYRIKWLCSSREGALHSIMIACVREDVPRGTFSGRMLSPLRVHCSS